MRRVALLAAVLAGMSFAAQAQPVLLVFFPLWSGDIDDAAKNVIGQAAAQIKQSGADATITGYADSAGSDQANLYLTELRAQRVIDGLVADGVPAERLKLVARGAQMVAGVASRRVEIAIAR